MNAIFSSIIRIPGSYIRLAGVVIPLLYRFEKNTVDIVFLARAESCPR